MTRAAFWNILQRNDEAVSSMIGGDFHSASTVLRDCFVMIREDLIRLASPSTNRNSNVDRGHDDRRRGAGGVRTNITHHHDHQDHASLSSFAQLITPTAQAMVAGESSSKTTHLQQQEADSTNTVIVGDFFVYSRPLCFLGGGAAPARYYTGGTTRMTCSCADEDDPSLAGLLDGQVISMTIIFNMTLLYHQRFMLLGDTSALTKCQKLYLHVLQLTQIMEEEEHEGAEPEDEGTFVVSAARRRFSWEIGFLATNNYFHCSRAIGDHEAALRSALHLQAFAHEASSSSSGMTTSSSASSSFLASPPSTTASITGGSRPWGGALSYQHQQNEIHRQQRGEEYHHLLLISPNELNELLINTITLQSSIVHDDDDDEQRTGERHHQQERFFLLLPHAPAA